MKHFYFLVISILCFTSLDLGAQAGCCTAINSNNFENYCIANLDPCTVGGTCTGAALDAAFGITGNWAFGTACNTPADCSTSGCFNLTGSLPIEMGDFYIDFREKGLAVIWSTVTEVNNKGFSIEKSRDGIVWEAIGFMPGNGDSEDVIYYEFLDNSPAIGFNYYRLKQIDFDGSFEYTALKVAIWQGGTDPEKLKLAVLPNPARDWFTLALPPSLKNEKQLSCVILNQNGQILKSFDLDLSQEIRIDISNFLSGFYILKVASNNEEYTARVVKP